MLGSTVSMEPRSRFPLGQWRFLVKVGDLVKHIDDGNIGLVVECDYFFYSYKITWAKWSTTGWYSPDRLVVIKKV